MKRICIIHHPIGLGGVTSSMLEIVDILRDKYEVLLYISKEANNIRNYLESKKYHSIYLKSQSHHLIIIQGVRPC